MRRLMIVLTVLAVLMIGMYAECAASTDVLGESIVRMTEDWPNYIDPAVGSDFSECISLVQLYDTLVFPMPDGSVRPHLAYKWDVSPDGTKYTFYLREGVKFHNGDELTAEDVEFSMKRLMDIGEGFAYLFTGIVDDVRAIDRYTVEMNLTKPVGPFVKSLIRLYIVNKDQVLANLEPGPYGEFGDYGKKWLLENDAGSGPYRVREVRMEEYVIGEKYEEWWGGWAEGAPDVFKLSGSVEPVTVRTLVAQRELEISDELQPLENYEAMARLEGVEVATYINGNNLQVMLHTKKPPTDCIHFRKALAYCIDYDAIITDIYPGSRQARGTGPVQLTRPQS